MNINGIEIGSKHTFVIAEIGNNHNGCLQRAKDMIDLVQKTGADCVKFQMRHMEETYRTRTLEKSGDDLGTEYVLDLLERFQITNQEHKELSDYCKEKGILYLCTPWDLKSVEVLETFNVNAYKVSSADLTNLPLLDRLSQTKKPLILSSGMSTTDEVTKTISFLNKREVEFAILHCNSTYPAPLHDINLRWIDGLKKLHSNIGYSGHERGINVSLAATAMGASIIERHFTLDRNMEGPDHAASLEFNQFSDLVIGIREIEQSLGRGDERIVSQGEMINRENLGKSLVSSSDLPKGTIIEASHIKVRSPGQGLSPQNYEDLIGKTLKRDMISEDFFFDSDINNDLIEPKKYQFNRPWGVPVRYHDFQEYSSKIDPDFCEFHFSFSDMDLNPRDYIPETNNMDFIVHAPELFANSQLMDLATPDDNYRNNSIKDTQRIIDITNSLKDFFPKTLKPMIVTNIGGFSMDEPLREEDKDNYYTTFGDSLDKLNMEGV